MLRLRVLSSLFGWFENCTSILGNREIAVRAERGHFCRDRMGQCVSHLVSITNKIAFFTWFALMLYVPAP